MSVLPGQLAIDDLLAADEAEPPAREHEGLSSGDGDRATCWLSPEQAAGRTPLSRKAIYGAIRRRELRASKRCGRWMIRERDLEDWFAGGVPEDRDGVCSRPRPTHLGRPTAGSLAALRAIEQESASQASGTVPVRKDRSTR